MAGMSLRGWIGAMVVMLGIAGEGTIGRADARGGIRVDRNTVSLVRWADDNGFRVAKGDRPGEWLLTNRWASLEFRADDKRMNYDGTSLWLSFPAKLRGDALHVSAVDVEKTLRPLLKPPRWGDGRKLRTVALSAGHGGRDSGNQVGAYLEKEYTLRLAREVERQLIQGGFKVVQVRSKDEFIALDRRPAMAKRGGADILLCLHYNAFPTRGGQASPKGVETYCLAPAATSASNDTEFTPWPVLPGNALDAENLVLAHRVHAALAAATGREDRGVRRAHFVELAQARMPAVLIEGGYLTNAEDRAAILSTAGMRRLASAIVEGVVDFKRTVERSDP